MNEMNFLRKIKNEGRIELVEPSDEMKSSYLKKSEDCLKSAKILLQNQLYDNSTSEAYYGMYNALLALFFKVGIKSENHSASLIIFKRLFHEETLRKMVSHAKEERIDKQYYVEAQQTSKASKESCSEIVLKTEDFSVKMKLLISQMSNEKTNAVRSLFQELFNE